MELGNQIKKYRTDMGLSQDQLAEKVYVSRQSISNWENDKTYPDIKSLLLLSDFFGISLDQLVKGDMEEMKKNISEKDIKDFNRLSVIITVLALVLMLSLFPLVRFLGLAVGAVIWGVIWLAYMLFAIKVERSKKNLDIHTYLEITAFMNGEELDKDTKLMEKGKRPYQRILAGIIAGAVTLLVFAAAFILCSL